VGALFVVLDEGCAEEELLSKVGAGAAVEAGAFPAGFAEEAKEGAAGCAEFIVATIKAGTKTAV